MAEQPTDDIAVEIRDLAPQPTVSVRVVEPTEPLGSLFDELIPRVAQRAAELGGEPAGPPYGRHYEMSDQRVDIEIGMPLQAPVANLPDAAEAPRGELAAGELPGGRAAVTIHRGSYATLPQTYKRLRDWLAAAGHAAGYGPWESYVDDPTRIAEEEVRTEISWPLG